jgi:hypothetical protein
MRAASVAVIFVLGGLGCASIDEDMVESPKRRCAALRDHLIDLRVESANGVVDVKSHREALHQALGEDFVSRCSERPVDEIKCAMAAKDTSSVAACSASSQ